MSAGPRIPLATIGCQIRAPIDYARANEAARVFVRGWFRDGIVELEPRPERRPDRHRLSPPKAGGAA
jgi:hypothetical protein